MGQTPKKGCFLLKRITLVLSLWCVCLPLLYLVSQENRPSFAPSASSDLASPPKGSFGPFSTTFLGPDLQCKFSLSFDKMSVSKGSAGLFKTALYQNLNLTGVRLQSFSYTPSETRPSATPARLGRRKQRLSRYSDFDPLEEAMDLLSGSALRQGNAADFKMSLPDCSRAAQLNISGFQWLFFHDKELELTVKSHRALLDITSAGEFLLKGHVILTTPDQTIEANHVVFDLKARRFRIPGDYVLSVSQQKTYGRNVCLDSRLLPIEPRQAALFTGENVCLADPLP